MKKPVTFFVFNRPDKTGLVFDKIREYKPKILFIISDAPREGNINDQTNCKLVQDIVEKVDWECEVLTNHAAKNMGCGRRISSGIDWVFEFAEESIFLEDDCLPNRTFFEFCEKYLDQCKNLMSISHISGYNPFPDIDLPNESFLSNFHFIWGWATWKDRWVSCYDYQIRDIRKIGFNINIFKAHGLFYFYWRRILSRAKKIDTWDHQWSACNWNRRTFSVIPKVNLIRNIGIDANGTHTTSSKAPIVPTQEFQIDKGRFSIPLKRISFDIGVSLSFLFKRI